ncbi:MAG: hypothetical protein JNK11_10390 [Alphaproteobacteria bacterium]|nr:hypothetical protein [Alphaproteobacteria bacterium]
MPINDLDLQRLFSGRSDVVAGFALDLIRPRDRETALMLLQAARALDRIDLDLIVCVDLERLDALNRWVLERHPKSWYPQTAFFDPRQCKLDQAYWFAAVERGVTSQALAACDESLFAKIASCCAERVIQPKPTFAGALESLHAIRDRSDAEPIPGEAIRLSGEALTLAQSVGKPIGWCGSGWTRSDKRGLGLAGMLSELSRSAAVSCWDIAGDAAFLASDLYERGMAAAYGYDRAVQDVAWLGSARGDIRGVRLLWSDAATIKAVSASRAASGWRLGEMVRA